MYRALIFLVRQTNNFKFKRKEKKNIYINRKIIKLYLIRIKFVGKSTKREFSDNKKKINLKMNKETIKFRVNERMSLKENLIIFLFPIFNRF